MPMYGPVRYGEALYGRDAGPSGSGGIETLVGDKIPSAQASSGMNAPSAQFGPDKYFARSASHYRRLMDENGDTVLVGGGPSFDGRIMVDGSITETIDAYPRAQGNIRVANPEGLYTSRFTEGQVILVRDDITYPNGITYGAYLGGGRMGITQINQKGGVNGQDLNLTVMNAGILLLSGQYQGPLYSDAISVASQLGLMGPDGLTASVQGILAYLLILSGASAVGIEGTIVPVQSWQTRFLEGLVYKYISAFDIPYKKTLAEIAKLCMDTAQCSYWVDWDGTAIIKAKPRDVFDIGQQVPIRRYSESGADVFFAQIVPSPKLSILRVEVVNQNASGTPRSVRYKIPPLGGVPILDTSTGNFIEGRYKRFEIAAIPTSPIDDATAALDAMARKLAYQESLKANTLNITTPPDPFVRAGDQVIINAPTYGAVGAYRCKSVTHPLGSGPFTAVLQRLFFPGTDGTDPIAGLTDKIPGFQFAVPWTFMPTLAMVAGPMRPELYHVPTYTMEGFAKITSWPKSGGAWVPLSLFTSTDTAVELTTANGTDFTVTVNAWSDGGIGPGPSGKSITGTFNFAWTNDGDKHHWALQRMPGWVGLFIDGVLKGSNTGVSTLTLATDQNRSAFFAPRLVSYDGASFLPVDAANPGAFYFWMWRFSQLKRWDFAGFTPLITGFTNTFADYPAVPSLWTFEGLNAAALAENGVYYAPSATSALTAALITRQSTWLAGIAKFF